ncbi:MAG: hypothetical protein DBX91_06080 [Subdoligranulum variabile]|nr:MAG: hypothetical protein DBX91_06080 [Subdoligranulum variabile]
MASGENLHVVKTCIDSLETPCGTICIMDEAGGKLPFSLRENPYRPDYCYAEVKGIEREIQTKTNYLIVVDPTSLRYGETYRIALTGTPLAWGDSDERRVCVSGIANGYSIALGAYDPNEKEKLRQGYGHSKEAGTQTRQAALGALVFEKEDFVRYDIEMLDDASGFRFRRIDDDRREITFPVAWVKNVSGEEEKCQSAVEFWTT